MPIPPGWDVERGAQLYREGWTLRQLAAEFNRTPHTIRVLLIKDGVIMRPARLPESGPHTARLVELREQGLTFSQIAAEVGMTEPGVHARFRRHGLLHGRARGWAAGAIVYELAPTNAVCARCDQQIPTGTQVARLPGLNSWGWAHTGCLPPPTATSAET